MKIAAILSICGVVLWLSAGIACAGELPDMLAQAQEQLNNECPSKACKLASKWIKANDDAEEFMDDALAIKAEALFCKNRYYKAMVVYEELLDDYPASRHFEHAINKHVDIAKMFLGGKKRLIWGFIAVGAKAEAIAILEKVADRWPGSELAATAIVMQGDYYYEKSRYVEAQETYRLIAEHYRNSSHYAHGLLRCAESTHAQYGGKCYDASALEDARIRYLNFASLFPGKAHELGVSHRLELIELERVEKEFEIADFYRRTHKIDPARYYWQSICERWPDSPLASRSKMLLEGYSQGD